MATKRSASKKKKGHNDGNDGIFCDDARCAGRIPKKSREKKGLSLRPEIVVSIHFNFIGTALGFRAKIIGSHFFSLEIMIILECKLPPSGFEMERRIKPIWGHFSPQKPFTDDSGKAIEMLFDLLLGNENIPKPLA